MLYSQSYRLEEYRLSNILKASEHVGRPHLALENNIYVTGTNGKGSTIAFLKEIFSSLSLSFNVFTSPHIESVTERIVVRGKPIEEKYLKSLLKKLEKFDLSFFESMTLVAYMAFAEFRSDINIIEVGIGGRLDATNILGSAICSVITSINYDHCEYLGDKISEIAYEKACIIKENSVCVIARQKYKDKVYAACIKQAMKKNTEVLCYGNDFETEMSNTYWSVRMIENSKGSSIAHNSKEPDAECNDFEVNKQSSKTQDMGLKHIPLPLNLLGDHQIENATTAIIVAKVVYAKLFSKSLDNLSLANSSLTNPSLSNSSLLARSFNKHKSNFSEDYNTINNKIKIGIRDAKWPGRLETIRLVSLNVEFMLDGAHNESGGIALKTWIDQKSQILSNNSTKKRCLVIGMKKSKDAAKFIKLFIDSDLILFVDIRMDGIEFYTAEKLIEISKDLIISLDSNRDADDKIEKVDAIASKNSLREAMLSIDFQKYYVVCTGSLFLIADCYKLKKEFES